MAKTRAQLIDRALFQLGEMTEGNTPSAWARARVDENIEPVLDDLSERGVFVADPDEVPDSASLYIADILAWHSREAFGVVGEELAKLSSNNLTAEQRLRALNNRNSVSIRVKAEYF
jgi:hypothetical protein